jgi:hypothetical protein
VCWNNSAGLLVDDAVKASSHEQHSTQKAQKQMNPPPLLFVALVLTHGPRLCTESWLNSQINC